MEKVNRLGLSEFSESLWINVSQKIVTDSYIETYKDFIDEISYDMWKEYHNSEQELSILMFSRMVESFFFNLFHYESSCEPIKDEMKL